MKPPGSDQVFDTLPRKPNFLLVVVLAGAALLILFLSAFLLLSDTGKKLLPNIHRKQHPTSYLGLPVFDRESLDC